MCCHGLEGFLGFVGITLEEEEKSLVVVELPVVLALVLGDVVMEFLDFFAFIFVVFDLPVVEEPTAFLAFFCFLLFF